MEYYLEKKGCVEKQLRSHTVKKEELPSSNPELMFERYLDKEKRELLIKRVIEAYFNSKAVREIAKENNISRKDVQKILKACVYCGST